jgi:hypothetical protein
MHPRRLSQPAPLRDPSSPSGDPAVDEGGKIRDFSDNPHDLQDRRKPSIHLEEGHEEALYERTSMSDTNRSPCYLANIRVIFENNSEPADENSKNACSTGIFRTSRQFDIREEQGAPNCPNTERALANWEAGK